MTAIDFLIIGLATALGMTGLQAGLVSGFVVVGGFAVGAVVGGRVAPLLLSGGSESAYAPLVALVGGLVVGALGALSVDRLADGLRKRLIRGRVGRVLDRIGGGILFAFLMLALAWVLGAVALNTPGFSGVRADVQRSKLLGALYEVVPPRGRLIGFLREIDPQAQLRGPDAVVAAPPDSIGSTPQILAAGDSVVRVFGTACGLGVSGSGWVGAPGRVVTNAHVVAGIGEVSVATRDGDIYAAQPIYYDPANDLAVLEVPGFEAAPLRLAAVTRSGRAGAVLGYPEAGPFSVAPARLSVTERVESEDSYGNGPIEREMVAFRGQVISGNSGGPVVSRGGHVLATVFASALGTRTPNGLGVPNAEVKVALATSGAASGTGPCAA